MSRHSHFSVSPQPREANWMDLRRGDLLVADLGDPKGRLSWCRTTGNCHASMVTIVPVSSREPRIPTHVPICSRRCPFLPPLAFCEHVRTVDRERVLEAPGEPCLGTMAKVDQALAAALGLAPSANAASPPQREGVLTLHGRAATHHCLSSRSRHPSGRGCVTPSEPRLRAAIASSGASSPPPSQTA